MPIPPVGQPNSPLASLEIHSNSLAILHTIFPWLLSLCKKYKTLIDLLEILMNKESCNVIGQEYILIYNMELRALN